MCCSDSETGEHGHHEKEGDEETNIPGHANGVKHSSGQLNAKQHELLELQALAQRRLKGARTNFADGVKVARETKRDLEWTQKRVE